MKPINFKIEDYVIDDLALEIMRSIDWPEELTEPDAMPWAVNLYRRNVARKIAAQVILSYDDWLQTSKYGKNHMKRLIDRTAINEEWE